MRPSIIGNGRLVAVAPVFCVIAMAGCLNPEMDGGADQTASLRLPAALAVVARNGWEEGLEACARIGEKGKEEKDSCQKMAIVGDSARLTVGGLGEDRRYVIEVEFSFHSEIYGEVQLATTRREMTIAPGENRLNITRDEYVYPDDDGDGWNNLRELERGTHPWRVDELLASSPISPGGMGCAHGGLWVESGIDGNADGVLAPSEVKNGRAICNTASDPRWRMDISWAYPGANCTEGGLLVRGGVDGDGDGVLHGDETTRVRFVCDGGLGWKGAHLVSAVDSGDAVEAQVAVGSNGNAVVVWQQRDELHYHIWARRFSYDGGWDDAVRLEANESGDAASPQVAMDDAGNVLVVWQQSNGIQESIWASRFVPSEGWERAVLVENNDGGPAVGQRLSMNGAGEAMVVWRQNAGENNEQIWAAHFAPAGGWGETTRIDGGTGGDGWLPDVAIGQDGNAIAVWVGWDNGSLKPWANHHVPGKGWGVAERIGPDIPGRADFPRIAVNAAGEAVVVWEQLNGTRYSVWSNRFVPGEGWGNPGRIETDNGANMSGPQVAMDASGNVILVWQQSDGVRESIWAVRFEPKSGWGDPAPLVSSGKGAALNPRLAVGPDGDALVAWIQSGERGEIWVNRFLPDEGWGKAELISIDEAGSAWHPELALGDGGTAMVVWHQGSDERGGIWSNRFHVR